MEVDITDCGERVTPDIPDWVYYAHLSIYRFARQFSEHKRVLDAGCGTGYGSRYLLDGGAACVTGVDYSAKVIQFCKERFSNENLHFQTMDLNKRLDLKDDSFDVVFSSNVMEHLTGADTLLREIGRVSGRDGTLVVAVPPITTPHALEVNLANRYHVNNLTPRSWFIKLSRFFHRVQGFRHWVNPEWIAEDGLPKERELPVDELTIRETDFSFEPVPIDELNALTHNITAIFVAEGPRTDPLPATPGEEKLPADWNAEAIYARTRPGQVSSPQHVEAIARLRAERDAARSEADSLRMYLDRISGTMAWRIVQKWWQLGRSLMPPGSRRRRIYQAIRSFLAGPGGDDPAKRRPD